MMSHQQWSCHPFVRYVWMVVVLSDENVSMGEAIFTFALFPVLLGLAYAADKGLCSCGGTQVKHVDDENARLLELAFENADGSLIANKVGRPL
jgi:hypothetical protein